MRATEFIVEYRNRLLQYVKSLLPTWPEYVLKDWLVPNKGNFSNLPSDAIKNGIMEKLKLAGLTPNSKWQLVPDMKFTMDMFEPNSKRKLIGRAGGSSDLGMGIPKDKERHATQAALAQQQGGVRSEPVLLLKTSKGYELIEGWHRTIQHFHKFPDGYTGPAYIAVAQSKQGVAEGKLTESAIFLNPNTVIVGQRHGRPLKLSPNILKQIQAIAAKHGAWYEGNGTDRGYTKGQIDRYVGSWDDEVAKTANSNDPKWIYVLFANVDENNRVQRVGIDPNDTIFNRLLATAKDNSFQGIGYTSQALQKFLQMTSEGKYDFLKMSQQPATQENLTRFLKAGEALMWPSNWEQYPNKAGKIAKAATVDVRDQYLATRKAGVYVTGSGHLKAVQNITGKQGVAEGFLNEFAPGEGEFGPFKVYISNEFIEEFPTFDQAKEEIEFLRTADPKSFDADWKIIDGTGKIVWQHDPGEAIDAMRMRRKIQFIKPDDKGVAEGSLNEFAPVGGDNREPDEEELLRQLASMWWLGTEQQMVKAQKTLAAMGWEIGQDESGDDDAGVFVIRVGDVNGDSYMAFPHSELNLNEGL